MKSDISGAQFKILDSIVHGVMVTDLYGHIIYSNPASEKIFGYSKSESKGMSIRKLYDEDDTLPFRVLLEKIIDDAPIQLRWHGVRKDNSRVWLDIRANLINNENGEPVGCVISLHVIEDFKRTEYKLKKNKAFAEAILETSVDSILSVNDSGKIIRINDATTKLFGYEKEELIGRSVEMLIPPFYSEYIDVYLGKIQKNSGETVSVRGFEIEALNKSGTKFPVVLSIAEVTWNGKKIYTAIVKDLTKRRELERRIIDIGNEERRRIGRDLHDGLGQMLTGIRLHSENMTRKLKKKNVPDADEAEEIVAMVRNADEYVRKLSHGMVVTELENKGLMHAIRNLCERTSRVTGINCTFLKDDGIEIEDFDIILHLFRIVQEAVNNAIKHSRAKNINIALKVNPHFSLIVEDDGTHFDLNDDENSGTGIQIMNYRAKLLGGHFELYRTDENKTRVQCDFPTLKKKS